MENMKIHSSSVESIRLSVRWINIMPKIGVFVSDPPVTPKKEKNFFLVIW